MVFLLFFVVSTREEHHYVSTFRYSHGASNLCVRIDIVDAGCRRIEEERTDGLDSRNGFLHGVGRVGESKRLVVSAVTVLAAELDE